MRHSDDVPLRIGLDIGGTFTDLVLIDGAGGLRLHKLPTTPDAPEVGALQGVRELLDAHGAKLADCEVLVHGTTLVTNAVIERRGVRTALLTTRGFRDVLEMGREQRYDIYDLFLRYPEPLVPRRLRLELTERIDAAGNVVTPLDTDEVLELAGRARDEGVQAIAICLLHSYRNPSHERQAAACIRRAYPELAVSVSADVVPEIREFERASTTVCNAYVQPLVDRYLDFLDTELRRSGFGGRFFLMQSSGGLVSPATARALPVRLLESGPAGGAMVAAFLGRSAGIEDLLAFDMGGTTAKLCVVAGGRPDQAAEMEAARVHRFKRGSGLPIKAPVLDLMEIGAGGGSIAQRSQLGLLQVGPRSAGAAPGPACYGRGGDEPTVTDACLALGYLDPTYFLGGAMALDRGRADAVLERLGSELGIGGTDAAWGVYQVVCERMASAARVHVIEKGRDPRRFPVIAFGGAGPLHAARTARALGAPEVIVPPLSGVASALGFLIAPVAFDFGRSLPAELGTLDWEEVAGVYEEMERGAAEALVQAGVGAGDTRIERSAEMRLKGQFHDIQVPLPSGPLGPAMGELLRAAFDAEYERLYHAVLPGYERLVFAWRLRAAGPDPVVEVPRGGGLASASSREVRGERRAYFPETGFVSVPVMDRYALDPGATQAGPAIVEERESTTIVNPGDTLRVDSGGNLRIAIGARS